MVSITWPGCCYWYEILLLTQHWDKPMAIVLHNCHLRILQTLASDRGNYLCVHSSPVTWKQCLECFSQFKLRIARCEWKCWITGSMVDPPGTSRERTLSRHRRWASTWIEWIRMDKIWKWSRTIEKGIGKVSGYAMLWNNRKLIHLILAILIYLLELFRRERFSSPWVVQLGVLTSSNKFLQVFTSSNTVTLGARRLLVPKDANTFQRFQCGVPVRRSANATKSDQFQKNERLLISCVF